MSELPRAEARAPEWAVCPHCGFRPQARSEDHRFVYSTKYEEAGVRRVTCQCRRCRGVLWWDEELRREDG